MNGAKLIFFFSLAVMAQRVMANIAEFDEIWQQRAKEAPKNAMEAYQSNPEEVTEHLNRHVRM